MQKNLGTCLCNNFHRKFDPYILRFSWICKTNHVRIRSLSFQNTIFNATGWPFFEAHWHKLKLPHDYFAAHNFKAIVQTMNCLISTPLSHDNTQRIFSIKKVVTLLFANNSFQLHHDRTLDELPSVIDKMIWTSNREQSYTLTTYRNMLPWVRGNL